jgi:uncharacterized membrane protein
MEVTYKTLLIIHASMGGIALIAGTIAALMRKGSKNHTKVGRLFGIFMLLAAFSALILTSIKPNPFLLGIGLFTIYLVCSGWIWIRRMQFQKKVRIAKIIGGFGLAAALFMAYTGLGGGNAGIILFVFAGVMTLFAVRDLFGKPKAKSIARLHGGRMGGAFIAAITAFLVTNVPGELGIHPLVLWIGPAIVGSVLISYGIKQFYSRAGRPRKA